MQFFLIISLLNDSLGLMNEHLIDLNLQLKLFNVAEPMTTTSAQVLTHRLFSAYLTICTTVVEFNGEEGTIVLLIYIYTVFDIMNSFFIMASSLSVQSIYMFLQSEYITMMWLIYQIAIVILWVEACQRTEEEFQKILNTVSKLMCTPSRLKLPALFDFYEFQMPKFCPHGIFDFTRSITIAVFGFMTTFLVIVKQFNIKDKIYSEDHED
nr:uncharacterized protein LOC113395588 [Vanessa tameamea]